MRDGEEKKEGRKNNKSWGNGKSKIEDREIERIDGMINR